MFSTHTFISAFCTFCSKIHKPFFNQNTKSRSLLEYTIHFSTSTQSRSQTLTHSVLNVFFVENIDCEHISDIAAIQTMITIWCKGKILFTVYLVDSILKGKLWEMCTLKNCMTIYHYQYVFLRADSCTKFGTPGGSCSLWSDHMTDVLHTTFSLLYFTAHPMDTAVTSLSIGCCRVTLSAQSYTLQDIGELIKCFLWTSKRVLVHIYIYVQRKKETVSIWWYVMCTTKQIHIEGVFLKNSINFLTTKMFILNTFMLICIKKNGEYQEGLVCKISRM